MGIMSISHSMDDEGPGEFAPRQSTPDAIRNELVTAMCCDRPIVGRQLLGQRVTVSAEMAAYLAAYPDVHIDALLYECSGKGRYMAHVITDYAANFGV